jgi:hypothetical protein
MIHFTRYDRLLLPFRLIGPLLRHHCHSCMYVGLGEVGDSNSKKITLRFSLFSNQSTIGKISPVVLWFFLTQNDCYQSNFMTKLFFYFICLTGFQLIAQAQKLEVLVNAGLVHGPQKYFEWPSSAQSQEFIRKNPIGLALGLGLGWIWQEKHKIYLQYQQQEFSRTVNFTQDFMPQGGVFVQDVRLRDKVHNLALGYSRRLKIARHHFWLGGGLFTYLVDPQRLSIFTRPAQQTSTVILRGLRTSPSAKVGYQIEGGIHLDVAYENVLNERVSWGLRGQVFFIPYFPQANVALTPFISVKFNP